MAEHAGQGGTRSQLFRWMGWFSLCNAVVLALVGLRYFSGFTPGDTLLSWIYLLLVYPGHHLLLAALPLFALGSVLVLVRPSRHWLTLLGVLLYAGMIAFIMLDSLLWANSRFHLNGLTAQILGWQSWVFAGVFLLIAMVFEFLLAGRVWRWVEARPSRHGAGIAWFGAVAIIGSQFIHAWADAAYYVPVTSVGQQLPVYKGFTAKKQLTRLGLVDPQASREREVARRLSRQLNEGADQVLNYPSSELQCGTERPLNLLLILSDAMRSDVVNPVNTPFLHRYASEKGQWFRQHFSGGNSSRMGVFSLFYGLPPGYWSSFEALQRSSVLIDELQQQDYQLGLFSSSTMYRPVSLDRTAFARVADLRLRTEPADAPGWQRDRSMTRDWMQWLDQRRTGQPFFGFLFYDATNTQDYPPELDSVAELQAGGDDEMAQRFSNYRKSARFIDGLVEHVVQDLEARGLADQTVIVFTSDHGEEFDDSGLGLKDHGSGYTRYQLQVPLIMHWPGRAPEQYSQRSSHYDIVPTLMQELLGCSNPAADYASGNNLFDRQSWDWLLAGSYYNYAVIEPDQITVTYPNGRFEVRDWNYRIAPQPQVRGTVLEAVSRENARFYSP